MNACPKTIGRRRLGDKLSDGDRLCDWGHDVPAGHPLYWHQAIGQYDDGDPVCLEHAIEQYASEQGYGNETLLDSQYHAALIGPGFGDLENDAMLGRFGWLEALIADLKGNPAAMEALREEDPDATCEALTEIEALIRDTRRVFARHRQSASQTPEAGEVVALAERVSNGSGADNALDVLIEVALFEPDTSFCDIRANNAGSKVICTLWGGDECTFRADDWTMDRPGTAAALRALAHREQSQ